jgi:hypothetical protein
MKSAEIADTDDCCSDFLHEEAIMPAPAAGIRIHSRTMAASPPAAQDPDTPTPEPNRGAFVRRELLILGIAMACGLLLMPFLIWLVGNRVLGPYTHGQDATAGTGPLRLLADYFGGLAHGSVIFWCVAAGPYVLVTLIRLLYAYLRSDTGRSDTPGTPTAPRRSGNLQRGRIEPHL